jgi:hypothetical protein
VTADELSIGLPLLTLLTLAQVWVWDFIVRYRGYRPIDGILVASGVCTVVTWGVVAYDLVQWAAAWLVRLP